MWWWSIQKEEGDSPVLFQADQTTPGTQCSVGECSEMKEKDVGTGSCLTVLVIPADVLSAYSIPGTVLIALCVLSLLICTATL